MRVYALLVVASCLLLAGCSSSGADVAGQPGETDAGADATGDSAPIDSGKDSGVEDSGSAKDSLPDGAEEADVLEDSSKPDAQDAGFDSAQDSATEDSAETGVDSAADTAQDGCSERFEADHKSGVRVDHTVLHAD